jgi:hypothetical protein
MIPLPILLSLAWGLTIAGLSLLAYLVLTAAVDLIAGGIRRIRRALQPDYAFYEQLLNSLRAAQTMDVETPSVTLSALRAVWRYPIPLVAGLVLAGFVRDWLLSSVMALIGIVAVVILASRAHRVQWNKITDDAELLVVQFAARFSVHHSVSTALEESEPHLSHSTLRPTIDEAIRRVRLGQPLDQAVTPFARIPHPVMRRMARVLAKSGTGDPAVYAESLELLRADTQAARDMQNRIRSELGVVSSTVFVLQAFLAVSLILLAFVPLWREYFTATTANRLLYALMAVLGAVGSLYTERRYGIQEEQA